MTAFNIIGTTLLQKQTYQLRDSNAIIRQLHASATDVDSAKGYLLVVIYWKYDSNDIYSFQLPICYQ